MMMMIMEKIFGIQSCTTTQHKWALEASTHDDDDDNEDNDDNDKDDHDDYGEDLKYSKLHHYAQHKWAPECSTHNDDDAL